MAGLVLTQEGAKLLWQWMLSIKAPVYPTLHLIGVPYTVTHTSTQSLLLPNELVDPHYGPAQLVPGNWTLSPLPQGQMAQYVPLSWNFAGAQSVQGYWLSDDTDTISIFGENFAEPFVFNSTGGIFTLTLPPDLISLA